MNKSTLVKGEYINGPRESFYVNSSCPECGIVFQQMVAYTYCPDSTYTYCPNSTYTYCPDSKVLLCSERCHVSFHHWLIHGDGSGSDDGSVEQEQERVDGGGVEDVGNKYTNEDSVSSVWDSRDVS